MSQIAVLIRRRHERKANASAGAARLLRWLVSAFTALAVALLSLVAVTGSVVADTYNRYVAGLPDASDLERAFSSQENNEFFQTTKIYDRTGQRLLYEVIDPRGGDRQWLSLAAIPEDLRNATIAIEDKTFYTNPGYDAEGILRAFINNLRGRPIQGGSSITQQLVKNVLIPPGERTQQSYERKFRELVLAAESTRRYSKDQILEWYLNTNFYGNLAYGIDAASLVYFGKHATELSLAESAMLAAIPQYPALNPIDNPEQAKTRQVIVLEAMAREGYITFEQAAQAAAQPLHIQPAERRFNIAAPHFTFYVLGQLIEKYGADTVYRDGLHVYTTLDLELQDQAECAARTQMLRLSGADPNAVVPVWDGSDCVAAQFLPPLRAADVGVDHHLSNAAVVVLRPATGEVLAMVGSLDYWNEAIDGRFNVAADGLRQPGSSFKVFTYLTAFAQGYTPASMLLDVRTAFPLDTGDSYVPENYDRRFHGPVRMRVALARSYNVPAVQTMSLVGVDNVLRTAHRMGINSLAQDRQHYGLALTLGGGEVTLLDMTYAYSVLANSGVMAGQPVPDNLRRPGYRTLDPVAILRVEDAEGRSLYEYSAPQTQPVVSPPLAYLMNDVLSDVEARWAAFGRDNPLELDRPAAAKTGTTNDFVDNWTLGYTPQVAAGVWVGNSDSTPMENVSGLTGAAPIWHAVMTFATRDLPPLGWERPPGVVEMTVCDPSGRLPTAHCPTLAREVFVSGSEPHTFDNVWQVFRINRETGKLATVYTPPELVEERVYAILPPEAADWVREAGLAQPPDEYDALGPGPQTGDVLITSPALFDYVKGALPVVGTVKGDNLAFFRLQYGPGLNPAQWTQIGQDRAEQVENGELQVWETSGLAGLYTLQLLAVNQDQSFAQSAVQVTVDNQPPSISLVQPEAGEQFNLARDESVVIQPEVQDNLSLARVEYYVDGVRVKDSTVPPFTVRWKISGAGSHTVYARAYDAAGNMAESQRVTFDVSR